MEEKAEEKKEALMAKISQGENGLLIDGEPLDPNGIQELSDEELKHTSGGITVIQHFDGNSVFPMRRRPFPTRSWPLQPAE